MIQFPETIIHIPGSLMEATLFYKLFLQYLFSISINLVIGQTLSWPSLSSPFVITPHLLTQLYLIIEKRSFFPFTGKCVIFKLYIFLLVLYYEYNFLCSHHIGDNLLIKIFRLNTEKHNLWQLLISFSRFLFIIKSFFHLWAQTVSINCAPPPASSSNTNYCWRD